MPERVFPPEDDRRDELATHQAADLLEQLLDQISRPDHDWVIIDRDVAALAELTAAMAALQLRFGGTNPPANPAEED